ncbi:hypothetical protein RJ640_019188 [Escallonia rubra]|uniref:Retrotransposon gag domain-containing protein n=1 Tax=Escallonia rubra TaxID=112253 RepID=A0AA88R9K4_9ASTE|nr:hypothetical protein RJ640_019188 [Escallonia rubra]
MQNLERRNRAIAPAEILQSGREDLGRPEGGPEDEEAEFKEQPNPFGCVKCEQLKRAGLEERLARTLEPNSVGFGVKLKICMVRCMPRIFLIGNLIWKEQRARQGMPKKTWELMKSKLKEQFLPADYSMDLYEQFHGLRQWQSSVKDHTSELNNLSQIARLKETDEQVNVRYLSALRVVPDEMRMHRLSNAFKLEERAAPYGPRRLITTPVPAAANTRTTSGVVRGAQSAQRAPKAA